MRRCAAAILLPSLLLTGCTVALVPEHQEIPPEGIDLVIEISGSPGVTYQGSLGTGNVNKSIEGQIPAEFTVKTAVAAVVSVTKEQEDGELTVRVLRGGQEVARRTTTAPFGTVTVVYRIAR